MTEASSAREGLLWRLARRCFASEIGMAALLFLPAGSFRYWQAWVYMFLQWGATACFCVYFYQRDPQLVARRLLKKEKITEQKIVLFLWKMLVVTTLIMAGSDHRFGWSRAFLAPVPLWLELLGFSFVLAGHILFFQVMQANRFGASIIQVEAGQAVMTGGPYALIRHPMYLGFSLTWLFTPPALGSFIAWPVSLLILPLIVFRLLNEEKMLRRDLPGYVEYCRQTPHRLIPCVW